MASIRWNVVAWSAGLALVCTSACSPQAADTPKPADTARAAEADTPTEVPAAKMPAATADPEITLSIGKPAPPLAFGSWVKGEPIDRLKPGQVYVVEFWATWCGPCLAGMPHLSKLQTEYGEKVRIIGVSREEEDVVREFLKKDREEGVTWDQTVTYSLAMDANNAMNTTWFRAAGRTGIPSAFLVGRDGLIEWIGHPASIDEPLAKVIDGQWDRAAAIAAYEVELKQIKAAAEGRKYQTALLKAMNNEDWAQAVTVADEWIAKSPDNPLPRVTKLSILSQSGQSDAASAFMKDLVKSDWEKGQLLTAIANGIAIGRFPGSLNEAESFALRAVELSQEKGLSQLHGLARVYAEKGQLDDAIKWEKKALEQAKGNLNSDVIERTLRQYEERKAKESQPAENGAK